MHANFLVKYTIYIHARRRITAKRETSIAVKRQFSRKNWCLASRVQSVPLKPAGTVKKPRKFSMVTSVCCYAKIREHREQTWKDQLYLPRIKGKAVSRAAVAEPLGNKIYIDENLCLPRPSFLVAISQAPTNSAAIAPENVREFENGCGRESARLHRCQLVPQFAVAARGRAD